MDYFNSNDSSFYSSSSWPTEVNPYEFLRQLSASEAANSRRNTFTGRWSVCDHPGHMVGSGATITNHGKHYCNFLIEWCLTVESPGPLASATSWMTQPGGNGQPSYSGQYWPTAGNYAHPHSSWLPGLDDPSTSAMGSGVFTTVPTPGCGPRDYWGENSGPSMGTFYKQNVQPYQPSTGPTRTGLIPTGWFQPYELSCTGENEYRNAEAGPSTLVPPPAPCVGLPMPQPSGGISETTADADNNQTPTEEDKAPRAFIDDCDLYRGMPSGTVDISRIEANEQGPIATAIDDNKGDRG